MLPYYLPPPAAIERDPAFALYLERCMYGVACKIELYPDMREDPQIQRFSVRKRKANDYRAIVYRTRPGEPIGEVRCCESDRIQCGQWLRAEGVPVLLIGPPQEKRVDATPLWRKER